MDTANGRYPTSSKNGFAASSCLAATSKPLTRLRQEADLLLRSSPGNCSTPCCVAQRSAGAMVAASCSWQSAHSTPLAYRSGLNALTGIQCIRSAGQSVSAPLLPTSLNALTGIQCIRSELRATSTQSFPCGS